MTDSSEPGSSSRALVHRGVLAWLVCSLVGAAIVALPDDDDRVFSISSAHGPSPQDLLGVVVMVLGWVVFLAALWRARHVVVRSRRALGPLFLAGLGLGLVIASVSDWPHWWLVGALLAVAAQLALAGAATTAPPETRVRLRTRQEPK